MQGRSPTSRHNRAQLRLPRNARSPSLPRVSAEKVGNWTLAVSLYEQALRLRPNNRVIMDNLDHARAAVFNTRGL